MALCKWQHMLILCISVLWSQWQLNHAFKDRQTIYDVILKYSPAFHIMQKTETLETDLHILVMFSSLKEAHCLSTRCITIHDLIQDLYNTTSSISDQTGCTDRFSHNLNTIKDHFCISETYKTLKQHYATDYEGDVFTYRHPDNAMYVKQFHRWFMFCGVRCFYNLPKGSLNVHTFNSTGIMFNIKMNNLNYNATITAFEFSGSGIHCKFDHFDVWQDPAILIGRYCGYRKPWSIYFPGKPISSFTFTISNVLTSHNKFECTYKPMPNNVVYFHQISSEKDDVLVAPAVWSKGINYGIQMNKDDIVYLNFWYIRTKILEHLRIYFSRWTSDTDHEFTYIYEGPGLLSPIVPVNWDGSGTVELSSFQCFIIHKAYSAEQHYDTMHIKYQSAGLVKALKKLDVNLNEKQVIIPEDGCLNNAGNIFCSIDVRAPPNTYIQV